MFASADMSCYVECVIRKYFNVLNHIRWADKESCAKRVCREQLRRYINNSEEIIFAEQFIANDGLNTLYEPIRKYLDDARKKAELTKKQVNSIIGSAPSGGGMATHYFGVHTCGQFTLPTEEHYIKLREHMDLKPYDEIKAEYEALLRTFKLTSDKPYNNTWSFKQTPARKGRHPCEKPEDLISHIIHVSSNENDLIVDPFCRILCCA